MILQPATRKILAVALVVVAVVSLVMIWKSSELPNTDVTTQPDQAQQTTLQSAPLFITETAEGSTLSLDSLGATATAITLRLLFDQPVGGTVPVFVIDSTLAERGWQVVLQQVSADGLSFEVALAAMNASSGMVLEQDDAVGTVLQANNLVHAVDPSVSLAVLADGEPLSLELASE